MGQLLALVGAAFHFTEGIMHATEKGHFFIVCRVRRGGKCRNCRQGEEKHPGN